MRVAVVLTDGVSIALIERVRDDQRYYLFPGGRVDPGETPETAAIREAFEELGLRVEIIRLVAQAAFGGEEQLYFLARTIGGVFGTGRGEEMTGKPVAQAGSYRAVRWPVATLSTIEVRPSDLAAMVERARSVGWPTGATELAT